MDKIDICIPTYKKYEEIKRNVDEIELNTPEPHRIIASCQNLSASKNRNYCLSYTNSDIIIMMDDDITNIYKGWLTSFIEPMLNDDKVIISSVRLLDKTGKIAHAMGCMKCISDQGVFEAERFAYKNYYRVPTSCIAIRKNDVRFDEGFKGSGYEDTTYMNRINEKYPNMKMTVNNNVKLIHLNEEKEQGGENFIHNKNYYLSKYPDDPTVINQKDWTTRKR